jgi:hypothetical protein
MAVSATTAGELPRDRHLRMTLLGLTSFAVFAAAWVLAGSASAAPSGGPPAVGLRSLARPEGKCAGADHVHIPAPGVLAGGTVPAPDHDAPVRRARRLGPGGAVTPVPVPVPVPLPIRPAGLGRAGGHVAPPPPRPGSRGQRGDCSRTAATAHGGASPAVGLSPVAGLPRTPGEPDAAGAQAPRMTRPLRGTGDELPPLLAVVDGGAVLTGFAVSGPVDPGPEPELRFRAGEPRVSPD